MKNLNVLYQSIIRMSNYQVERITFTVSWSSDMLLQIFGVKQLEEGPGIIRCYIIDLEVENPLL